ncbi:hypothetical protein V5N11_034303 [Cardamine amara subsp. amara]|uniref:Uncharacterized protein n=1 Tax=Cardamine amara subsp. amara TaxID=228776 RepID=A0ABD1C269_CARAN
MKSKEKGNPDDLRAYVPPLPFPGRNKKHQADKYKKLFEKHLKDVELHIPLLEALMLIPPAQKYLKDLVKEKTKEIQGMVLLTHQCSAIIQKQIICKEKLQDPGSFTLPYSIDALTFKNCLCDLGASISLMPLSVAKRLGYTRFSPSNISLVLADRSVCHPHGLLEDLPVRIWHIEVPTDFVVLEMNEEPQDPLILGRPFLATAGALIDVKNGTIDLKLGKEVIQFNIKNAMKQPHIQVFGIGEIEDLAEEFFEEIVEKDHLKTALTTYSGGKHVHPEASFYEGILNTPQRAGEEDTIETLGKVEEIAALEEVTRSVHSSRLLESAQRKQHSIDSLDCQPESHNIEPSECSAIKAPTVELKPLPEGLRYAFLGKNDTYPVIVNDKLKPEELSLLLNELRKFRKAIGYSLDDIKGISPSLCTHRIHLENETHTSVEHQRCLNPNLKKVVKKEIIKLLDAGIIYPISDSTWVSHVH